jgi:hypothetical protein
LSLFDVSIYFKIAAILAVDTEQFLSITKRYSSGGLKKLEVKKMK